MPWRDSYRPELIAGVALLPAAALAAVSLYWTVGALTGRGLWPADEVTLAEAIATRNSAEAVRLISFGEDPNARMRVRAGMLAGHDIWVTPLEAAVWTRDAALARMLLAYGALADSHQVRVLRCLDDAVGGHAVHDVLAQLSAEPWPDCSDFQLPGER
jgi:hypothetical protein